MIKHNSKVELHYSITSIDDKIFESTFNADPVIIVIGSGIIPQKLEMTLYGLSDGKEQTMILGPADAFGEKDESKVKSIDKKSFPNKKMIKLGNVIEIDIKENNGKELTSFAIIKEINKNNVILDLNHPLAGIDIKFKVKIIKVYG
tara:strand:- start:1618 stop:2055 length:438 start_codon:yes stop_codon:yes gene_type:complete